MGEIFNRQAWIIIAVFMLATWPCQADLVVIGNPAISVNALTEKQTIRLWLAKSKSLPGGGKPQVVDQAKGSAARAAFYEKLVKKSKNQLKAYWAKVLFTGKGAPPKTLADDAAVKQWVASNAGGLGYVNSSVVDDSVKVMLRLP